MPADTLAVTTCRSCGAKVIWAWTQKLKREPLDAAPVPEGNIEIIGTHTDDDGKTAPQVRHLKKGEGDTLFEPPDRYVSHFYTCPDGPSWRKK